jgi:hypothetical protein
MGNSDPLRRIEKFIENDIEDYLGADVFDGGCFFLNMLVELSGQSASMSKQILRGFVRLSGLLRSWLQEANEKETEVSYERRRWPEQRPV